MKNYYEILEVDRNASQEVLEKALPKELEEYYTNSYIETYMDNIDIRSDSRVN